MINCRFCNHKLIPGDLSGGAIYNFICDNHPTKIGCMDYHTYFYYDNYQILLQLSEKKTYLGMRNIYPFTDYLLKLDYLIDIAPENAISWFDKLLSLKAFL